MSFHLIAYIFKENPVSSRYTHEFPSKLVNVQNLKSPRHTQKESPPSSLSLVVATGKWGTGLPDQADLAWSASMAFAALVWLGKTPSLSSELSLTGLPLTPC